MNNVWEDYKETFKTISELKIPSQWSMETIERYIDGLFSFAKFKVGDQVEMADTYPVNIEDSWGWMAYRHLLVRGSKARVMNVDWRDGKFIYYIKFLENTWIDDENTIHPCVTSELGTFCLSEKWLTDKVDVE